MENMQEWTLKVLYEEEQNVKPLRGKHPDQGLRRVCGQLRY